MPSPMIHSVASYDMQAHSPRILEFFPRDRVSLEKATGNHPIHIYSLDGVTPRFLINLSLDYSIA